VVPGVRAGAKAPALLLEGFGAGVPRPLAADIERTEVELDGVVGDLYDAGGGAPPVLLVPGAAPAGRADERVVDLALAVARSDRTVFVPQLSLFEHEIDLDDVDRVARATQALAQRSGGPVVLLGFSFGGSLSLVAAADDRARDVVRLVATFGSYADLVGVVQAVTTGTSVVAGRQIPWEVPDDAAELLPRIARSLVPQDQQDALTAALQESSAPPELPAEAAALHELLVNTDPQRTGPLTRQLGPTARTVLDGYSPATVADRLSEVPVLAAHSRDDPAVPYAELLRLEELLPHARTMTVDSFRHVDLELDGDPLGLGRDLLTSWSFVRRMLAAQERWPWQG
jgi:pimeloyl-ACP methyl ester carboxylesterase